MTNDNWVDDISRSLSSHGIKPSYSRIKIMEYLRARKNHPTVDQIYAELVKEMPTLSKTTVYNTLNLFIEADLTRLVTIEDHETRYDADTAVHGHFKCENCGGIYDFPVDLGEMAEDILKGFRIRDKDVYFRGVCPECLD